MHCIEYLLHLVQCHSVGLGNTFYIESFIMVFGYKGSYLWINVLSSKSQQIREETSQIMEYFPIFPNFSFWFFKYYIFLVYLVYVYRALITWRKDLSKIKIKGQTISYDHSKMNMKHIKNYHIHLWKDKARFTEIYLYPPFGSLLSTIKWGSLFL